MNIEVSRLCPVMYRAVSEYLCVQHPEFSERGKVVCMLHSQKFCCKVKRNLDTAVEMNKGFFSPNKYIFRINRRTNKIEKEY